MPNHPQMSELADEHGMDLHYGGEEKMPDHVHDWELWNDYTEMGETAQWAECKCGEKMLGDEMVRRLNATERLSAEGAKEQARLFELEGNTATAEMFFAYASALEGE